MRLNDLFKVKLPLFGPISPVNRSITVTEYQAVTGDDCHMR